MLVIKLVSILTALVARPGMVWVTQMLASVVIIRLIIVVLYAVTC